MVFSKDNKHIPYSASNLLILITLLELKIVQLCCQLISFIAYVPFSQVIFEPSSQFQMIPFEAEAEDWIWSGELWSNCVRLDTHLFYQFLCGMMLESQSSSVHNTRQIIIMLRSSAQQQHCHGTREGFC